MRHMEDYDRERAKIFHLDTNLITPLPTNSDLKSLEELQKMVMEELMLVNPESTERKRRRKLKTLADHLPEAGQQVKSKS